MKLFIAPAICLAICFLISISCQPQLKPADEVDDGVQGGEEETVELPALFTGYYSIGSDGPMLKSSPDGEYYKVIDESGRLQAGYNERVILPNEPVHVEVSGKLERDVLTVNEIINIDYVKRDNHLFPMEFRCYGEEPFWHVDIIRDDEVRFHDLSNDTYMILEYYPPRVDSGVYRYEIPFSTDGAGENMLKITIEPENCMDSMSGESFEFRATLEYLGMTYYGCAERGKQVVR